MVRTLKVHVGTAALACPVERSRRGCPVERSSTVAHPNPSFIINSLSGSNSVVECDLAKVEVAGSNPVSRSSFSPATQEAP